MGFCIMYLFIVGLYNSVNCKDIVYVVCGERTGEQTTLLNSRTVLQDASHIWESLKLEPKLLSAMPF